MLNTVFCSLPGSYLTSLRHALLAVSFIKLLFYDFEDTSVTWFVSSPWILKCWRPSKIVLVSLSYFLFHIVFLNRFTCYLIVNEWIFVSASDHPPECQTTLLSSNSISDCWPFMSLNHYPNYLKSGWLSSTFPQICITHEFLLLYLSDVIFLYLSSST